MNCLTVIQSFSEYSQECELLPGARMLDKLQPRLGGMRQEASAPPDHSYVPVRARFRQRNALHGRMLALLSNHPRQKGDAKTGCGEFDDEIDLAAPAYDGGFETM